MFRKVVTTQKLDSVFYRLFYKNEDLYFKGININVIVFISIRRNLNILNTVHKKMFYILGSLIGGAL